MKRGFSAVSTPELVDEITTLAGHLNAASARFLALIAELDRRKGWAEWGVKSCAHWLNWKCGIDLGAARERVRVAHALVELPQVAAAMNEGRLSYAKVRAMTRVATPADESYLLNVALCGTASHVEHLVRGYRRALDAEELSRAGRLVGDSWKGAGRSWRTVRSRTSGSGGKSPDSKRRFRGNVDMTWEAGISSLWSARVSWLPGPRAPSRPT
jgi:Domain of unknown function (DUF222)